MILLSLFLLSLFLLSLLTIPFVLAAPQYGTAFAFYHTDWPIAPVGIAVDANGTVYWANYNTGQLLSSLPTSPTALCLIYCSPTVVLSGLNHPLGVAVDASGDLYFSEQLAGTVSELLAGSTTPKLLFSSHLVGFISPDQSGNVFFVPNSGCNGQGYTNSIMEYTRSNGQIVTILAANASLGNNPSYGQVFVNSAGLYFTTCTGKVELLPVGSSTPRTLVSGLQAGPSVSSNGVTADAKGDIFFTDYWNSVGVLPAASSSPTTLATAGHTHYGIALDRQGNVYYTDNLEGTIWKVPVGASSNSAVATTNTISDTGLLYLAVGIGVAGVAIGIGLRLRRTTYN